jgi:hypothetical protein
MGPEPQLDIDPLEDIVELEEQQQLRTVRRLAAVRMTVVDNLAVDIHMVVVAAAAAAYRTHPAAGIHQLKKQAKQNDVRNLHGITRIVIKKGSN